MDIAIHTHGEFPLPKHRDTVFPDFVTDQTLVWYYNPDERDISTSLCLTPEYVPRICSVKPLPTSFSKGAEETAAAKKRPLTTPYVKTGSSPELLLTSLDKTRPDIYNCRTNSWSSFPDDIRQGSKQFVKLSDAVRHLTRTFGMGLRIHILACGTRWEVPADKKRNIHLLEIEKGGYWPAKYHRGLTRKQNAERKRTATRRTRMSGPKAYAPWRTDRGRKTRRSSYTSRFHTKYPEAKTLPEIAKASGISKSVLQTVYNRGMAAWRTGHRPGASQHAWGLARVHSFVLKGKTWRTADKDLV